jgi:hypothetical protein
LVTGPVFALAVNLETSDLIAASTCRKGADQLTACSFFEVPQARAGQSALNEPKIQGPAEPGSLSNLKCFSALVIGISRMTMESQQNLC